MYSFQIKWCLFGAETSQGGDSIACCGGNQSRWPKGLRSYIFVVVVFTSPACRRTPAQKTLLQPKQNFVVLLLQGNWL